jgi:hypothetical protein
MREAYIIRCGPTALPSDLGSIHGDSGCYLHLIRKLRVEDMPGLDISALISGHLRSSAQQICEDVHRSARPLSEKDRKTSALSALKSAASHLQRQRWGRVRAALLLAFSLAPNSQSVWRQAVRLQVLSVGSVDSPSRSILWELLNKEEASVLVSLHTRLPVRLKTLTALERIRDQLRPHTLLYRALLRKRPVGLLKSAMAFADKAFFDTQHRNEPDDLLFQGEDVSVSIESQEELAECISSLVAEAVQHAPLHFMETGMPAAEYTESGELRDLIGTSALRGKFRYLAKHVDALDYELHREDHSSGTTYILRGPSAEHEQWLRYGYIERQLLDSAAPISVSTDTPLPSLRSIVRQFIRKYTQSGRELFEFRLAPYPRYRIIFPWEAIYRNILNFNFYEDAIEAYMDDYELQIAPEVLASMRIANNLTAAQFLRLYRALRHWALLHSEILNAIPNVNQEAFQNSLLPVLEHRELFHILSFTSIPESEINAFLDVISMSPEDSEHIDLQYTPLVRNATHFLILPRLVEFAGALRNTMMNMRSRAKTAGEGFALDIATLLKTVFGDDAVTTDRKLESDFGATDVDVAALANDCLYIWECKHSLPPTSPHEARDLWNDIEGAAQQVTLARKILLADKSREHRIRQWFPRLIARRTPVTRIIPVIVMSTKMWSGLCVDGIPIRDIHSLRRILRRDHWGVAHNEDLRPFEFAGFSLPGKGPISAAEIDDYLNSNGPYWLFRRALCVPISTVHAKIGRTTIACDTVMTFPIIRDWLIPIALESGYQFDGSYTKKPNIAVLPDDFGDKEE